MKSFARSFLVGCRFGAITALVVTLLAASIVYFVPMEGELAWDMGLIWYVFIMGPASIFSGYLGWDWTHPSHVDVSETFLGFVVTLLVNLVLYALIAGFLGSIFGWFGKLQKRYSVHDDNAA